MSTILYIWVIVWFSTGVTHATWSYAGTYMNPAACHTAAENMHILKQKYHCIDQSTGAIR